MKTHAVTCNAQAFSATQVLLTLYSSVLRKDGVWHTPYSVCTACMLCIALPSRHNASFLCCGLFVCVNMNAGQQEQTVSVMAGWGTLPRDNPPESNCMWPWAGHGPHSAPPPYMTLQTPQRAGRHHHYAISGQCLTSVLTSVLSLCPGEHRDLALGGPGAHRLAHLLPLPGLHSAALQDGRAGCQGPLRSSCHASQSLSTGDAVGAERGLSWRQTASNCPDHNRHGR